ncbi:MAG: hypothetical protein LBI81_02540 [Puniceicoccales bacterium]|jgi:hypothetical protein|nr:hypothetical protein [Puniceicoccales bacterium]
MNKWQSIGIGKCGENIFLDQGEVDRIKLQLLLLGHSIENLGEYVSEVIVPVIAQTGIFREIFSKVKCQADGRIENFFRDYLKEVEDFSAGKSFLPDNDFICDRYGVARILSLPEKSDEFHCEHVDSYRTYNGILHNPSTDKRTTQDVFHIVEGGLPVPSDKKEVPKVAFAKMLEVAFNPSDEILTLPFTAGQQRPVKTFVSNYIKPVICPKIDGIQAEKRMEIRFFVPGSLVSILDCVESIFGNAGSPILPENDAALDPISWTGHTGCIVFAPQLKKYTKKDLGLPRFSEATERQRRDGMCWQKEDELYHGGMPFKVVARDGGGAIVSIVADSYNGYGKKEIKTQMSYAANMLGLCEEEHSGGTLVLPRYDLGDEFNYMENFGSEYKFENTLSCCRDSLKIRDGFAVDGNFENIVYVPEYADFCLPRLTISWGKDSGAVELPFELGKVYILPSGYKVTLEKPDGREGRWKMVGTCANGIFCYKPATVSGGGKSEIAKPIDEFIISGPTIVHDYEKDCELVEEIFQRDFTERFRDDSQADSRKLLDGSRTLGSVIKLLTPSDSYRDEYNDWLATIPQHVLEVVFAIKRFSKDFGGGDWQQLFTVDKVNGQYGNELRYKGEKLFEHYLRVGFGCSSHRRLFSLRDDFVPAAKFQLADDITATTILPAKNISYLPKDYKHPSVKIVHNCEYRLYQRPDEAIVPGYDPGSERDMTMKNIFTCNFKPLTREDVRQMMRNRIRFEMYSEPMKKMLEAFVADESGPGYIVCPSELRTMPNGSVSKNQRYLQNRSDICDGFNSYLTNVSSRLWKRIDGNFDVLNSHVNAILSGRRNNPPGEGVKPLCVHGPLHYMDIPELFLEYMASITGKSPSTTGAGLEGAMTKGPFSCVSGVYDLNSALLGFILTGYAGFISAAGFVGPSFKVDHDISYLIPEIWSRMTTSERDPKFLIRSEFLERCENFHSGGRLVQAERLGYRITKKFVRVFAGRVFASPDVIFPDEMLRPELQNMEIFADSMEAIVDAHRRAAMLIIDGGELEKAIPPLRALLHIAADGEYEGLKLGDAKFRSMFARENVIGSEWYMVRLKKYQASQIKHLTGGMKHIADLRELQGERLENSGIDLWAREKAVAEELNFVSGETYADGLIGTLGK